MSRFMLFFFFGGLKPSLLFTKCYTSRARAMAERREGLISILPVRDDADGSSIGTMINTCAGSDSGERSLKFLVRTTDALKSDAKDQQEVHWHNRLLLKQIGFLSVLESLLRSFLPDFLFQFTRIKNSFPNV